jgi:Xaa-Pro dipeptidase
MAAPAFARGQSATVPEVIRQLRPMEDGIQPIADQERNARMEKARRLMVENQIDAVFLEGNTSTCYFTGTRWGGSERTFGLVFPARGELGWVVPGFEEARARELIRFGTDIRTWEEDESPYRRIVGILKDRGISTGRVGIEEQVPFFVFNGIRMEAPQLDFVSADPVTAGCRMIKSPAEIALLQRAHRGLPGGPGQPTPRDDAVRVEPKHH